jgi:glycosyltransferase involved in cell wall biosynthesis
MPISVTILTKNSSRYIEACLSSVADFDEVVILDNGSTDNTLEIAARFANVKIFKSEFIGFGPLKNLAQSHTNHEWVLSIDSDEVLTPELYQAIRKTSLDDQYIYGFNRLNHFKGKPVRCCGWDKDTVKRLYNKTRTQFDNAQVHESLQMQGLTLKLIQGNLLHYSYDSVEELIDKLQKYSTLWAEQNYQKKTANMLKATYKSIFAFFKNYVLQKGFLHGNVGMLISVCSAFGVFAKYTKLQMLYKTKAERRS